MVIPIPLRLFRPCISSLPHVKVHEPLINIYQNIYSFSPCSEPLMGKIVSKPEVWKKQYMKYFSYLFSFIAWSKEEDQVLVWHISISS